MIRVLIVVQECRSRVVVCVLLVCVVELAVESATVYVLLLINNKCNTCFLKAILTYCFLYKITLERCG